MCFSFKDPLSLLEDKCGDTNPLKSDMLDANLIIKPGPQDVTLSW